mmetsp:Transcript_33891/g.78265  ORF Transcript_33891/g.78265 Transcript_33891/m.78265 type:complete len:217 (-) Transcript_33891:53-703(-)
MKLGVKIKSWKSLMKPFKQKFTQEVSTQIHSNKAEESSIITRKTNLATEHLKSSLVERFLRSKSMAKEQQTREEYDKGEAFRFSNICPRDPLTFNEKFPESYSVAITPKNISANSKKNSPDEDRLAKLKKSLARSKDQFKNNEDRDDLGTSQRDVKGTPIKLQKNSSLNRLLIHSQKERKQTQELAFYEVVSKFDHQREIYQKQVVSEDADMEWLS